MNMNARTFTAITFVVGVVAGIVLCVFTERIRNALPLGRVHREQVTLTSLSPDETTRVRLVEIPAGMVDRNFELRVENLAARTVTTVFRSPDEGLPEGSERIVWASDGSRFFLVGRRFVVNDAARLPTGESLYLMYDLATHRTWCNATQQSQFPSFSRQDVENTGWQPQFQPASRPTTQQHRPDAGL
ncbi:MAG: hypothetical protein ACHRHE_11985 [Tepidisphaerales bacterium]